MKLSLCIATYNEEKNIHYPLDSAYGFVDEVIIVDGGSTDRTVEIAKSYGSKVKVFIEKNPSMFHINKQKAIERANGVWVLQLDADEEISQELKKEIEYITGVESGGVPAARSRGALIERAPTGGNSRQDPSQMVACWLPRKNLFLGRFLMKGGQYPDYTIRLYKNGSARFPCKTVHENVEIITDDRTSEVKEERSDGRTSEVNKIGRLKNPILHYADPTFSRYLMRWNRYNNLDAELLIKRKPNFFDYIFIKPMATFFSMYFRHLGFLDSWQGLVFAFFSSIRYVDIYFKAVKRQP